MAKTTNRRSAPARRRAAPAKRRPWRPSPVEVLVGLAVVALGGAVVLLAFSGSDEAPDQVEGGAAGVTGPDFHSLVADPTTPGRIFVGGHQAVSASTDDGKTWTRIDSLDDADAMGWGFSSGSVFVSGHPGLNRSDDDVATFTRVNEGLPGTDVHAFGVGRDVLYGSAVDGGFFGSDDDGVTWEVRAVDGTQAFFGRIVVDPADDEHLFASDAQRGVAESNDGGRSWMVLDSGLRSATWLSRSRDNLDLLVASGPSGAALSRDGGASWEPLALPDGASLVEVDQRGPDALYAGSHDGAAVRLQISRDAGETWTSA